MSGISQARQKLRDYAREAHEIELSTQPGWVSAPVGAKVAVVRGEAAGKVFVAVQEALRVAEELREESRQQPVIRNDDKDLAAKAEAADRIEAAVFLALS